MTALIDTSALLAYLDRDDADHARAKETFASFRGHEELLTHNYVVVETAALAHRRLGPLVVRALFHDVLPVISLHTVDDDLHRAGTQAFLAGLPRRISLVDRVSFELMRRLGIQTAFAFDRDFRAEGFQTVP